MKDDWYIPLNTVTDNDDLFPFVGLAAGTLWVRTCRLLRGVFIPRVSVDIRLPPAAQRRAGEAVTHDFLSV